MHFVSLDVSAFQAISKARVEFAPGLNVLFGPNDLGKSTLVTALRSALFLPAKSAAGSAYRSWFRDAVPRVVLTLRDDSGRYWRVTKEFGEGHGLSELHSSKDNQSFTAEASARQVDEKLRALLGWGVPPPGGRGGPTGLPSSFIINALLAGQAEVDTLLTQSLAEDPHESGRLTLTRALSALAQDPLFKEVLGRAQQEVALYFTETGKRRSGARSPFTQISETVKRLTDELAAAKQQLEQSRATEHTVAALKERVAAAQAHEQEARRLGQQLTQQLAQAREREAAEARLQSAKKELGQIDGAVSRRDELVRQVQAAERAVDAGRRARAEAEAELNRARDAVAAAESAVRQAQSADGAKARALERAKLEEATAKLETNRLRLEGQRERLAETAKRGELFSARRRELEAVNTGLLAASKAREAANTRVEAARAELELARAIHDYGRWRDALRGAEQASRAVQESAELRARAVSVRAQLAAGATRIVELEQRLERSARALPNGETVRTLEELEKQLKLAEAAIGGGLSVVVRPHDALRLHAEIDDDAPVDEPKLTRERTFEAERRVSLSIGQMVEIDVTAGSREQRKLRDALARRWRTEGLPVLAEAAVDSIASLRERLTRVEKTRDELALARAEQQRLEAEARSLEERADLVQRQGSPASDAELERRRRRIPDAQVQILEAHFATLNDDWEDQVRELEQQAERRARAADDELRQRDTERSDVAARQTQLRQLLEQEPAPEGLEAAPGELVKVTKELAQLTAEAETLSAQRAALEAAQGTQVKQAEQAVSLAKGRLELAQQALEAAQEALEQRAAAASEEKGRLLAAEAALSSLDRPRASAALEAAESAWRPLADLPVITRTHLEDAERLEAAARAELEATLAEFHKADGALSKTGGPLLREQVLQLEEALAAAKAREAEIELDARAWRLLQDTLRSSENAEGTNLGRVLAGPVSRQFAELTHGRYQQVAIDATLTTSGVSVSGAAPDASPVLQALSVGTKDQLATILRMALALQLKAPLVLDDHLVHTDTTRLDWFTRALKRSALESQVLIVTCRPGDFIEMPRGGPPIRDLAGGTRLVDLSQVIGPWPERPGGSPNR